MKTNTAAIVPEVIEKCHGMRKDGTCGNGMSDNHNNPCRGCGCPDRNQYEPDYGRSSETSIAAQNAGGIVKVIAQQIEAVRQAELICLFQRLRLGALVKNSVALLGLEGRGNGHKGDGVKGWWESTFRDADGSLPVSYDKIIRWGRAAEKIPKILRDRGYACAKNLTAEKIIALLAKDPEQVISKNDREVLEVADKETNGMTLRQMLLWGDDAPPRRPGRPKGSVAKVAATPDTNDPAVAARAVWSKIIVEAAKTETVMVAAARLLDAADVESAKVILQVLLDALNQRQRELKRN